MKKNSKKKRVARNDSSRKVKAVAPGQALGYGLQYTCLTALLLDAPEGSFCSFEVLDDLAQHDSSGNVRLAQTKSTLGGNPVSDKAIGLWKSLHNWVKAVQAGTLDLGKTQFVLYVSRAVEGEIVKAFSAAKTIIEVEKAVAFSKERLWGPAPEHPLRSSLSPGLAQYANPTLEADDCHLFPILQKFSLECGGGSPVEELRAKVKRMPVSPTRVEEILKHICGWVKVEVDRLLESKQPAVISRDNFVSEFTSFVRRIDRDLILQNFAPEPSMQDRRSELPKIYVRQLDLIELDFNEKLEAISDFLRACWNRTAWAQKGYVHESSFNELDSNLKRTWGNFKRRVEAEKREASEVDRARVLYSDCMEHKSTVQGMEPPGHFVPGCFHRLSDELEVGWHPAFRDLLKSDHKKKTA